MSPTHNKLKNIELEVFSKESSSFNKVKLINLQSELMTTYDDANNYTQAREKWHSVDKKLTELIDRLPKTNLYASWFKPIAIGLVIAVVTVFIFQPWHSSIQSSDQEGKHPKQEKTIQQ
jgi:hypothetical protein